MSGSNLQSRTREPGYRTNSPIDTAISAGMAWLDLLTLVPRELQRASLQTFSPYSPARDVPRTQERYSERFSRPSNGVQVIPVGEERLNVATRTIPGETTRVRRRVVEQPVEQQVTLREEKVIVERRAPTGANPKPDVLTETVIEMSDSLQVPTVWKSLHVAEEVVLRKQVTERVEKVRETVRRDVVNVEHARKEVSAPADEIDQDQEAPHPRLETEVERLKQVPSNGSDERKDGDKRQLGVAHDKKAGQGPAPQADQRNA
jgi:stress response protein YsnF